MCFWVDVRPGECVFSQRFRTHTCVPSEGLLFPPLRGAWTQVGGVVTPGGYVDAWET